MLLLSPGLALFLFGVSSLPERGGDFSAPRVWVSMLVGVLLMLAFVWHAFRPEHPLLDLRLFRNRNLTVSTITMLLFAAAFFGALLLGRPTSSRFGVSRPSTPGFSWRRRGSAP